MSIRIAPDLHQQMVAAAYSDHTSMTRWLIEAIREKLERDREVTR
jgi:predicted HicB family RNase H-like nuclease